MIWGDEVVARARGLVGTRFRPQGRKPGVGLDCVGTAAVALGVPVEVVPNSYAMRGQKVQAAMDQLSRLGLVLVPDEMVQPGDLLLMAAGPGQLHLAVVTDKGFVHADAGLGLVVERPGRPPWAVLGTWRLAKRERATAFLDEGAAQWRR